MPKLVDLTGKRFGRLTVIERAPSVGCNTMWCCVCDCGNKAIKNGGSLLRGKTKSCGCLRKEIIENGNMIKHGGVKSRLYTVWIDMKGRCRPTHENAKHYADRGIKVCDEWLHDFSKFREWAYANGYDENAPKGQCTIDRINTNGNYEPSNCRWVDMATQLRNTRRNRYVEIDGEKKTVAEWSRISGTPAKTVSERIARGWDAKLAVYGKPYQTIRRKNNASYKQLNKPG